VKWHDLNAVVHLIRLNTGETMAFVFNPWCRSCNGASTYCRVGLWPARESVIHAHQSVWLRLIRCCVPRAFVGRFCSAFTADRYFPGYPACPITLHARYL